MNPRELAVMAFVNPLPADLSVSSIVVREAIATMTRFAPLGDAVLASQGAKGDPNARKQVEAVQSPLRAIGSKLQPGMSPAQASAWLDGILLSLSKYPVKTVMLAAREAAQERFKYGLGSVDERLHELCEQIEEKNRRARYRLERFLQQIERASQPKIEADPVKPMTVEEMADLPEALWSMGITGGFIAGEARAAAEIIREEKSRTYVDGSENDAHMSGSEGRPIGASL